MNSIKHSIKSEILNQLELKIQEISNAIKSAEISRDADSKSSAGDKHETSRAKIQTEIDQLSKQLFNAQKQKNDLLNIDGIGETQINSIKNFFHNKINLKVLNDLKKILIVKDTIELKKNGHLKNMTFLITGKLQEISRNEAKSLIEQNSGSIVSNVTKKLDYLIIGEKPTNRKVDAAKNLGVKILDQSSWLKMLK